MGQASVDFGVAVLNSERVKHLFKGRVVARILLDEVPRPQALE